MRARWYARFAASACSKATEAPTGRRESPGGVLLRISLMVEEVPEITELDLNCFARPGPGCRIVDARIRVESLKP